MQGYKEAPPKPFKYLDKPGQMEVILQRMNGEEDIQITCELQHHPRETGTVEELSVVFTMCITKGGGEALEICCDCYTEGFQVNYIQYRDINCLKAVDDDQYTPNFRRKLSDKLKAEFEHYLRVRGLNETVASWVLHFLDDKGFRERLRMLESILAIIK